MNRCRRLFCFDTPLRAAKGLGFRFAGGGVFWWHGGTRLVVFAVAFAVAIALG